MRVNSVALLWCLLGLMARGTEIAEQIRLTNEDRNESYSFEVIEGRIVRGSAQGMHRWEIVGGLYDANILVLTQRAEDVPAPAGWLTLNFAAEGHRFVLRQIVNGAGEVTTLRREYLRTPTLETAGSAIKTEPRLSSEPTGEKPETTTLSESTAALSSNVKPLNNQLQPSEDHRLFLHLIAPRYYTDPPIAPRRIVTTKICLSEDISVAVGEQGETLSGRIERKGDKFSARLQGRSHSTLNFFEGDIELERPVSSRSGIFSGGIWSVQFVLSTNSDCGPFLKERDTERK